MSGYMLKRRFLSAGLVLVLVSLMLVAFPFGCVGA